MDIVKEISRVKDRFNREKTTSPTFLILSPEAYDELHAHETWKLTMAAIKKNHEQSDYIYSVHPEFKIVNYDALKVAVTNEKGIKIEVI